MEGLSIKVGDYGLGFEVWYVEELSIKAWDLGFRKKIMEKQME